MQELSVAVTVVTAVAVAVNIAVVSAGVVNGHQYVAMCTDKGGCSGCMWFECLMPYGLQLQ